MSHVAREPRRGFTLFQLLVLLALLAMLFALLLPAIAKVRKAAARSQCSNNLRQLVLALHNFNDQYGKLPPMSGALGEPTTQFGTLHFHILPYIEQHNLFKTSRTKVGDQDHFLVWANRVSATPVRTFVCPDDPTAPPGGVFENRLATTSYAGNFLVFGATATAPDFEPVSLQGGARIPASFQDGTSNTMVFAERYQVCNGVPTGWGFHGANYSAPMFAYYSKSRFQLTPTAADCDPALAQTPHVGGILVVLGDGSVRGLSDGLSSQTWWHACTPNGGELLGADW